MRQLGPGKKAEKSHQPLADALGTTPEHVWPMARTQAEQTRECLLKYGRRIDRCAKRMLAAKIIFRSSLADPRVVQKTTIEQEHTLPSGGTSKFNSMSIKVNLLWKITSEIAFLPPR
jgi:hypothetical protein